MTDQNDKWFEELYASPAEETSPAALDDKVRQAARRPRRTGYTYWHGIGVAASFVLAVFVYIETIDSPVETLAPSELQVPVMPRASLSAASQAGVTRVDEVLPVMDQLDKLTRQLSDQAVTRRESTTAMSEAEADLGELLVTGDSLPAARGFADLKASPKEALEKKQPGRANSLAECSQTVFGYCMNLAGRLGVAVPEESGCNAPLIPETAEVRNVRIDDLPVVRTENNFRRVWLGEVEYRCVDGEWRIGVE